MSRRQGARLRLENDRSIGQVTAEDVDNADRITGYTLTGGSDQNLFEINSGGALTFKNDPNFEDPKDNGRNNEYISWSRPPAAREAAP